MNLTKNKIYLIYFILYLSLLVGFYFNEDFALGYIKDYFAHKTLVNRLFNENILGGFLNYDTYYVPHSPVFVLYFVTIENVFNSEILSRLFNLHLCLLIPFFLLKSLKIKYHFNESSVKNLLPAVLFFSPYFRGGSIWVDDNIFAIIFFVISLYFFVKYEKDSSKKISNIFLNTLFLAISAYFRPIYSLFSIFFFMKYFIDFKFNKKFYFYIFINLILSFPALYYIFILDVNKWATSYLFRTNLITTVSLSISVIFFYLIPFLIFNYKNLKIYFFKFYNIAVCILIFLLLFWFFEFNKPYSGGIFYKASIFLFDGSSTFYIAAIISYYLIFLTFFKNIKVYEKINDIVILTILILLEIDGVIYHETYDPLIYILVFLIFKNKLFTNFINNFNFKRLIWLIGYEITFLFFSILKIFL